MTGKVEDITKELQDGIKSNYGLVMDLVDDIVSHDTQTRGFFCCSYLG